MAPSMPVWCDCDCDHPTALASGLPPSMRRVLAGSHLCKCRATSVLVPVPLPPCRHPPLSYCASGHAPGPAREGAHVGAGDCAAAQAS